ncbi:hypothetical protein [Pseudoduganella sp. OTU4001]|uniref:hypothetical protein n=1 Tax=Pseudoduganella sp. OTU4001 TaxID=3043854 RepID=UPI00313BC704
MEAQYDFVFVGVRGPGRERVEGKLCISAKGRSYNACSGSRSLLPLPNGLYEVKNLRFNRDDAAMAREVLASENGGGGMCFPAWSVDLEPLFSSRRTALRIHPDGNLPGTQGCIGILDSVHECYDDLFQLLAKEDKRLLLLVNHDSNNPHLNDTQSN